MQPRHHDGIVEGAPPQPGPTPQGIAEGAPPQQPSPASAAPPRLADDTLGPFAPPADYAFEPELREAVPRPIPALLTQGRFAQGKRKAAWGFLVVGLVLVVGALLPFMGTLALYFLPLAYAGWIGLGCCVIAGGMFWANRSRTGPYQFVIEGRPLVARIRELKFCPTMIMNGQTTAYRYFATVDFLDPQTGALRTIETDSNEVSVGARDTHTTSFRVGDYVTAIYLPAVPKTLFRLYGFLDLRPDIGVVPRPGQAPAGVLRLILVLLLIFLFAGGLCWCVYALGRFYPVDIDALTGVPFFLVGSLGLGLPLCVWIVYGQRLRRRRLLAKNLAAVETGEAVEWEAGPPKSASIGAIFFGLIMVVGLLGLSGAITLGFGITLNALLDDSEARFMPVRVVRVVQVTHNFILREYKIEYHFPDQPTSKHSMISSPDHLRQFETDVGIAVVRGGRFGWPWVQDILPVRGEGPRKAP